MLKICGDTQYRTELLLSGKEHRNAAVRNEHRKIRDNQHLRGSCSKISSRFFRQLILRIGLA